MQPEKFKFEMNYIQTRYIKQGKILSSIREYKKINAYLWIGGGIIVTILKTLDQIDIKSKYRKYLENLP